MISEGESNAIVTFVNDAIALNGQLKSYMDASIPIVEKYKKLCAKANSKAYLEPRYY